MTSIIKPARSAEYRRLLEGLKNVFVSAADTAVKLYEQGKKDGLSNEEIRRDIEAALDGLVKERRLREVLPLELKRRYVIVGGNSALSAESVYVVSDTPGWDQVIETNNFKVVDVADLGIFKRVIRNYYGSFKEFTDFCDSIKEVGLIHPIVVRPIPNDDDLRRTEVRGYHRS